MNSKIVKSSSKGQITLPIEWRNQFKTNNYILEMNGMQITVTPLDINKLKEEVIFDADRDNKGKGISVDEMIDMLKNIQNG